MNRLLRAAAVMERGAAAQLAAVSAALADVRGQRHAIVACSRSARQFVCSSPRWTAFRCIALANHTTHSARATERLASLTSELVVRGRAIAQTKIRWAKVRAGLARRAARGGRHG